MAATAKVPQLKNAPAEICKAAGVTYQQCFPPDAVIQHPGLCLFSAPITKGSTLAVRLDQLCVEAIQQRIVDWATENDIPLTAAAQPTGEDEMERARRG